MHESENDLVQTILAVESRIREIASIEALRVFEGLGTPTRSEYITLQLAKEEYYLSPPHFTGKSTTDN